MDDQATKVVSDLLIDLYARVLGLQQVLVHAGSVNQAEIDKAAESLNQQIRGLPRVDALLHHVDQQKLEDLAGILRTRKK